MSEYIETVTGRVIIPSPLLPLSGVIGFVMLDYAKSPVG